MERCRRRERRNYSKSFKIEAVRLLELGEMPAAQVARELGIRRNLLYKWRDQLSVKGDAAFGGAGRRPRRELSVRQSETVEEENARLRRELAELREERDILNCRSERHAFERA